MKILKLALLSLGLILLTTTCSQAYSPNFNSTATGNVGIGTYSPQYNLHIVGSLYATTPNFTNSTYLKLPNSAAPTLDAFGKIACDNNYWAVGRGACLTYDGTAITALVGVLDSDTPNDGQTLKWHTGGLITWDDDNNSAGITIADTQVGFSDGANNIAGNVGLTFTKASGTLTATILQSTATPYPQLGLFATGSDSDWLMGVNGDNGGDDDDPLYIGIGTTTSSALVKFAIKRDGNVGIGTTNPPNNFYVAGTGEMQAFKMPLNPVAGYVMTTNSVGVGTWAPIPAGAGSGIINSASIGQIAAYTAATTVGGNTGFVYTGTNLGVGTTSPPQKLYVAGTVEGQGFKFNSGAVQGYTLTSAGSTGVAEWRGTVINVKSYGATGDGSTDDTTAIQNAMNAAAGVGRLYFPKPSVYYKVISTLRISSNLTMIGDNSKIHMPAQANEAATQAIFDTNNGATTSNVDISGLYVESVNSVTGTGNNSTGYYDGATTSFVMGFNLHNTSDIRIHDCTLDALAYGLKIDSTLNSNLFFNNLKIINTGTNIYGSNITNAHFNNMYLDSTSYTATNGHLHNFYFETTVSKVYFNNVSMNNTAGGCVQIYQSGGTGATDILMENVSCTTAASAFIISAAASKIVINGFTVTGATKVFNLDNISDVRFTNGVVKLKSDLAELGNQGNPSTNVYIGNIIIDGSTATTNNYLFPDITQGTGSNKNIVIDNIQAHDLIAGTQILQSATGTATQAELKNSTFQWAATPTDYVIKIQSVADTWDIHDNVFVNLGTATVNLQDNKGTPLPRVTFRNNKVEGFTRLRATSDTATILQNNYDVTNLNIVSSGNVGIGTFSVGIGTAQPNASYLSIGPSLGVQTVGIGTTVPQQVCMCAGHKLGVFNGTWTGSCTCP